MIGEYVSINNFVICCFFAFHSCILQHLGHLLIADKLWKMNVSDFRISTLQSFQIQKCCILWFCVWMYTYRIDVCCMWSTPSMPCSLKISSLQNVWTRQIGGWMVFTRPDPCKIRCGWRILKKKKRITAEWQIVVAGQWIGMKQFQALFTLHKLYSQVFRTNHIIHLLSFSTIYECFAESIVYLKISDLNKTLFLFS